MPNSLFDKYGPWKPFQRPVPVPFARWDGVPSWCLTLSDEWAAYVIGAISALYQDVTWDTDNQEVLDDLHYQVSDLMDAIGPDCGLTWDVPSWRLKPFSGNYTPLSNFFFMVSTGAHREYRSFYTAWLELQGRQYPSELLWAGGKLEFATFQAVNALDVISVVGHTCLDELISDSVAGVWSNSRIGANTEIKDLTITCTGPGFWQHITSEFPDCMEI